MARRSRGLPVPLLDGFDASGRSGDGASLLARLHARLRKAILDGALMPGGALPASRRLAEDAGLSRNTVEAVYDQLEAEGFIERRHGSGSFVSVDLPERELAPAYAPRAGSARPATTGLSKRGELMAQPYGGEGPLAGRAFLPSVPALDLFPRQLWARLLARAARAPGPDHLGAGDRAGFRPLREAIAAYVGSTRAVACQPDQVVVLTSSQQAIDLACRLLTDPGDTVWHEEPGYRAAAAAFVASGAQVVPVPVDGEGIDVAAGIRLAPDARLVYVSPSHQFPTGVAMSLSRRLQLLAWAARTGAFIIEDDYDSEFRYVGRPLAALQGLDEAGRVVYVGTFNKLMFPGLRLAYLVAPPELAERFVAARVLMDGHTSTLPQAALADFIGEGHLGTHLRHMRTVYEERRQALVDAVAGLAGRLTLGPTDGGMHACAYLPAGADDVAIAAAARRLGIELRPLSTSFRGPARPGFIMGFAAARPAEIRGAVDRLARLLEN
ncbi:MAG TPA: PLP-dependent aminotransferase family protein [Aliidongia sp.]|uniref:MocR-like pyridoxine biosynthesis transcription factor PdxR n=1 Tax=Aliidongia sp. TaxID=1914230 RepID=UPI002DDCC70E|nr:PLP-dependent aminotransferase family protein [Aliidongia sp.]HEV2676916.1 PLP-dependent aminotransferase family protein [Aliidongia sp.]